MFEAKSNHDCVVYDYEPVVYIYYGRDVNFDVFVQVQWEEWYLSLVLFKWNLYKLVLSL